MGLGCGRAGQVYSSLHACVVHGSDREQGRALRPSEEQSEMGQPWSRVEKGQAPLLMWRYQATSGPGASSRTCAAAATVH